MRNIIVTGGNHHNTYGVIRALGQKNLRPFLLLVSEESDSFLLRSKYISDRVIVRNETEAIIYLQNNKQDLEGSVIIACSDGMSSVLDSNRDSLSSYYKLPGAKAQGAITAIMDKEAMSHLAREIGFSVPKSWIVETIRDIVNIEYPCITKPLRSKDGHKSDIEICNSHEELESIIKTGSCYCYQVQEFIEKDFEYQIIGLSINGGQEIVIPGFSRCIRPCPRTNTGFLHYESLEDLFAPLDKCEQFVNKIGYSGLFSIEFLRDKKGEDYFLEMNFRNDGNAICVTASGTNLPYLWYLANSQGNYKSELSKSTFRSVYVMPEFSDFESFVYTGIVPILEWVKDIYRTDTFMVFNKEDIKPFIYQVKKRIFQIVNKVCRKIFNN